MADAKLSDLSASGAVAATDVIYSVVTAGAGGVKATAAQLKTFMSASPTLVTPALGVATATSIAIGGATLGANALAITGHVLVEGVASTGATGTGKLVFDGTPTLVTPVLGVATVTSVNKVAITAPASSATLTIADGKTLTVSNILTLAGTDSTVMTFPTTSATVARSDAANTFTGVQTFSSAPVAIAYTVASTNTNAQTGTSYSLVAGDNGKVVTLSNAGGITLTVPASLGAGFACTLVQLGAGQVTITASSTTLNKRVGLKLTGQYSVASIYAYAADTFIVGGDLSA